MPHEPTGAQGARTDPTIARPGRSALGRRSCSRVWFGLEPRQVQPAADDVAGNVQHGPTGRGRVRVQPGERFGEGRDQFGGGVAAMVDPETHQLAAEACTGVEQLVHHLMLVERRVLRGERSAGRRRGRASTSPACWWRCRGWRAVGHLLLRSVGAHRPSAGHAAGVTRPCCGWSMCPRRACCRSCMTCCMSRWDGPTAICTGCSPATPVTACPIRSSTPTSATRPVFDWPIWPPRFGYLYDFGDGWTHDIEVLGPGEARPGCDYGEARCPASLTVVSRRDCRSAAACRR